MKPMQPQWEHARLAWSAEEENARRLAARKALILGVPLAALALSRTVAGPLNDILQGLWDGRLWSWCAAAGVLVAALGVVGMLWQGLPIVAASRGRSVSASAYLHAVLDPDDEDQLRAYRSYLQAGPEDAGRESTVRVFDAARRLHLANERASARLQKALEWFVVLLVGGLIASVSYILSGPRDDEDLTATRGSTHVEQARDQRTPR